MTTADSLYLALIAVLLVLDAFVLWPAFLRRSQVDQHRARRWLWSGWMIALWTMAGAGIAVWVFEARSWVELRLVFPHGWRLWVAVALVSVLGLTQLRTAVRIARSTRGRRVKFASPQVERLAPHTGSELGSWVATSLSAGFCEEFVFRGYLIWAFQPFAGLWGAAALSLVLFAAAHAYQGASGILASGIVGALLTLVVLIFGSLWPAMALHALVDVGQGVAAWLALSKAQGVTMHPPHAA